MRASPLSFTFAASLLGFSLFTPTLASAACTFGLQVRFVESAPVDRFEIKALGDSGWQVTELTFELDQAAGNIIFDPTATGAGVDAFAPFVETASSAQLANQPVLTDGDQRLALEFAQFPTGSSYSFTVDIDDQLTNSERGQIQVTGSELSGARVTARVDRLQDFGAGRSTAYAGRFDNQNRAVLGDSCTG